MHQGMIHAAGRRRQKCRLLSAIGCETAMVMSFLWAAFAMRSAVTVTLRLVQERLQLSISRAGRRCGVAQALEGPLLRRQTVFTLDVVGNGFVVRFLDAQSGADAGQVEVAGMPDWAQTTGLAPDAVQMTAAEMPEGVELRWRIRQPYRGGAPPPRAISAQAENAITGSLVVDPKGLRVVSAAGPGPDHDTQSHQQSPAPNVPAAGKADDRTFTLDSTGSELVLEARAGPDNQLLWRLPLATQRASRPPPLRK